MPQGKNTPTEYGGRPGLVQRLEDGHTPTPAEILGLMKRNDEPEDGTRHAEIQDRFEKA